VGLAQKDDDGNAACKDDKKSSSKQDDSFKQWLDYIDSFTNQDLDTFKAAWNKHVEPIIPSLSKAQFKELDIARVEMVGFLTEKETEK
jgi:hypothetical protein